MSHEGGAGVRLAVFLAVALAVPTLLVVYTVTHRRPPIPADADHVRTFEPAGCLACHGPAGKRPRDRNHPLNDQCFSCHERA